MGHLTARVEWTDVMRRLEALDWRGDSNAFDEVEAYVLLRIREKLLAEGIHLEDDLNKEDVGEILRSLADRFRSDHVSILMYLYFGLQRAVIHLLQKKGVNLQWRR